MLAKVLEEKLEKRTEDGTKRRLRNVPEGHVDLSSNDYLGLIQSGKIDAVLRSRLAQAESLAGSGGSRLISGETDTVTHFEQYLCEFYNVEATLTFTSGYDANLALIGALGNLGEVVFLYDELIHASMRDGFRLSRARSHHFRHNDLEDLETKLSQADKKPIVFVESIYSMDGDSSDFRELINLVKKYDGEIIVDEAHSSAIHGERGEGLISELGFANEIFARVHTWGKAHGAQGAVICGSELLKEYLVNFGRPFIYTTGVSSLLLHAARASYEVVKAANEERAQLKRNIEFFNALSDETSIGFSRNNSPIQTLKLDRASNSPAKIRELAAKLRSNELYVVPIFHPTVPEGEERIRISLHTFNSEEEIRTLFQVIEGELGQK